MEHICASCQHANPPRAKFCARCGAQLTPQCPRCSTRNLPGSAFCIECGQRLEQPAQVTRPAADRPGQPASYTPRHLAEQVLTSRSALEGEHKQVTVLFCDIADSSGLAQQVDPEGMHQIMDQTLQLMAKAVHRYEGTVNQYLGDGLMALFGAPVALEDHAFRAVQAALAMQETINGYSTQLQHEHGVAVRLRLGLNTGLVVVGRIGDDLRMDYTAVGNTTHLAARLQALAEPGTILITETTHRLVDEYIRSEALEPVAVRGQREPIPVYKVTGRQRWRSRLEIRAERGLTRLVGRQRELALLHDCLARVEMGRGQVVGIVGEAGVGKSRFLHEFHASLQEGRVTWVAGHCLGHGQATPYLPILDILRANFQIEEGDNPLQIQEKLRQRVFRLDPNLEEILPFLGVLFALPHADDILRHLDPKDKRQKIFEAIRALTVVACQHRPQVVIIENLHWIDQSSEDYLAFIIESLAGMRAMLLTTHRSGYAVPWADKTYYTQIALDLFTAQESEAMVTTLLGTHDFPADLLQIIQEKAGGNPLFIEEVMHALLEHSLLVRRNGGYHWAGNPVVEFPATAQDIMRARIDRLEDPVKRTVQTAAVIGRQFGLRLLTHLSEMTAEVQHYLETLKHLEFIHESRFFPELEYIFKHAVIQDVAYQSLLGHQRQALHAAIGLAIEDLYADRLPEQAAILAYHYVRSTRQDKAIAYALLAGDQAVRLHARAEATTYYGQALTVARACPPSAEAQRAQIDAILKLVTVGTTRQDLERDRKNLEEAQALAAALHDDAGLARVLYWCGRLHYVLGEPPTAIAYAEQSLAIADRLGDDTLAAPPVNLMGRVYMQQSELNRASQMMERSAAQMRRLGNTSEEATATGVASVACGWLGEFERAFTYADHSIRLAREIQHPFAEAAALFYRGIIHDQRGDWTRAMADYNAARRIAEGTGDLFRIYIVKSFAGRAQTMAGDLDPGRALLEESFALAEQIGTRFYLAWGKSYLAACLLAMGDLDTALALCHEAIRLAEDLGDQYPNALAHRTLAETLSRRASEEPQQVEQAILKAIRIQREIGAKPELARTYVSYARLLQGQGEREKARQSLLQAIDMYQQLGMAWDQARAEQILHEV